MQELGIWCPSSVVSKIPLTEQLGWHFALPDEGIPGENVGPDPVNNFTHLRQLYFTVDPEYKGRFTVPVLYDKKTKQIVNNEVWS